jgi:ubiquinone/menaquinone biosynthesis C-methylase UbiE
MDSAQLFDGMLTRLVAPVMAMVNRDTESEAVAHLAPAPDENVLVIGFGPGIGLHVLAGVITAGRIAGIDPSPVMHDHARRRNRAACDCGLIELRRGRADNLPWPDESFDAVMAINNIQLWDPFRASVAEVARVLRPAGRFVSFTHEWAIHRSTGLATGEWTGQAAAAFRDCGLADTRSWQAAARSGPSIAFTARRAEAG